MIVACLLFLCILFPPETCGFRGNRLGRQRLALRMPHSRDRARQSELYAESETKADYDNYQKVQKFNAAKTTVRIEAPTINSRKITADIIVNTPMDKVWSILTDYNNLATHVPNLVQSKRVQVPGEPAKIRLFQEGAQRIIGFDFRASLMMDMSEQPFWEYDGVLLRQRKLSFKLVESKMFQTFDGSWTVEVHSKRREYDTKMQKQIDKYKTKLTYEVFVRPRGPVPVIALEWRIKEDIPINLWAIKLASERLPYSDKESTADNDVGKSQSLQPLQSKGLRPDWASDETLGLYM